jgi:NADH dehydrogenase
MTSARILVVGGGFAGIACARRLERLLAPGEAELALVTPLSYELYLPLLPQVAAGVLTPQPVAVSLRRSLNRTRIVPGTAIGVDTQAKVCMIRLITDDVAEEPYDHVVLAADSVTRAFDIPGVTAEARGMKTLAEAVALRGPGPHHLATKSHPVMCGCRPTGSRFRDGACARAVSPAWALCRVIAGRVSSGVG